MYWFRLSSTAQHVLDPSCRPHTGRLIAAATLGIALEWYDFIVYGFFAGVIGRQFFPGRADTALLMSVATFGIGFVMRPIGAVVLGLYADRAGRRQALTLGMAGMALGTALIAFAPPFAAIGLAAPALVVAGRLVQGFASAGEYGGGTAFLLEHAPPHRRGLMTSLQQSAQFAAALLAALAGMAVDAMLSPAAVEAWGWRLPFALGLLVGPLGLWLRASAPELPRRAVRESTVRLLAGQRRALLAGFGATIFATAAAYVLVLYMPLYATHNLAIGRDTALGASAAMAGLMALLCPVAGALSDRLGRKLLPIGAVVLALVGTWPAFNWLQAHHGTMAFYAVTAGFGVVIAAYTGVLPCLLAEAMPRQVRTTGVSVMYNFAVTLFGGFAPAIVTWLIATTGDARAASWYVVAAAIPGLAGLIAISRQTPAADAP